MVRFKRSSNNKNNDNKNMTNNHDSSPSNGRFLLCFGGGNDDAATRRTTAATKVEETNNEKSTKFLYKLSSSKNGICLLILIIIVAFATIISQNNQTSLLLPSSSTLSFCPEKKEPTPQETTTTKIVEKVINNTIVVPAKPTLQECRNQFHAIGQGGMLTIPQTQINVTCSLPQVHNVCRDLLDFTGLSQDELNVRLTRQGRFHFEGEHAFWNPQSKTELAWYYSTSVDYLFANAIHPASKSFATSNLTAEQHGPILDYSGGVGNNVLDITKNLQIPVIYFGIGMMEFSFAQFRVLKHGVSDYVTFQRPYSEQTNWKFDPIHAPLLEDESLGMILAMDVLEHIPHYHVVVESMVKSIRVDGIIIENTPFGSSDGIAIEDDTRVHVGSGGISMAEAMGPNMIQLDEQMILDELGLQLGKAQVWKKISSTATAM